MVIRYYSDIRGANGWVDMADDEDKLEAEDTPEEPQGLFKKMQSQFADFADLAESTRDSLPLKMARRSFGEDGLLRNFYINPLDPSRLQAMTDAGLFLKDARELAGLSVNDLATAIGLKDKDLLHEVERGESTLSLDVIFRMASLLARHDPIPFIIKFLRTYSPTIDTAMEKLGVSVIPKHLERERRFTNIYRRYDKIRQLSDEEFDRFHDYVVSTTDFIVEVMEAEKLITKRAEIAEMENDSASDDEAPDEPEDT